MKLINLLKEIKIIEPGKSILWGYNSFGEFMELVKLRGFKTSQEALDKINQTFPDEDPFEIESHQINMNNPSYAYLADDGQVAFVEDLSEFGAGSGYDTEEGWGIDEWSNQPPL